MNFSPLDQTNPQAQRRRLLKLAGLGMGFGFLPLGLRLHAAQGATECAAGYWRGGAAISDFGVVSRGWGEFCANATVSCDTATSDELVSAEQVRGVSGNYRLRLIGAEFDRPVQVEVDHGGTRHGVWSAWRTATASGSSAMLAIRWQSRRGESLPLVVKELAGATSVAIPARVGVYVVPLEQCAVAWRAVALHAPDASAPHRLAVARTRWRHTPPSYLLVAVEANAAPQAV